jgi:hypothetical protein
MVQQQQTWCHDFKNDQCWARFVIKVPKIQLAPVEKATLQHLRLGRYGEDEMVQQQQTWCHEYKNQ